MKKFILNAVFALFTAAAAQAQAQREALKPINPYAGNPYFDPKNYAQQITIEETDSPKNGSNNTSNAFADTWGNRDWWGENLNKLGDPKKTMGGDGAFSWLRHLGG